LTTNRRSLGQFPVPRKRGWSMEEKKKYRGGMSRERTLRGERGTCSLKRTNRNNTILELPLPFRVTNFSYVSDRQGQPEQERTIAPKTLEMRDRASQIISSMKARFLRRDERGSCYRGKVENTGVINPEFECYVNPAHEQRAKETLRRPRRPEGRLASPSETRRDRNNRHLERLYDLCGGPAI